jgi:serine/threonine protein kinase/Tol biopolymer transport system component
MSDTRLDQLFLVFDGARQLEAAERSAFIGRSCGGDDALRAEVISLLEADAASGAFMVDPALDRLAHDLARDTRSLRVGEMIGPYIIVQRLGSGGAGEVWRARDDRLRRDVAIKVLWPHVASDPDRLRRFAEEARAAGALNHSNILTVYDVGEHNGIPYLVSECLEGRSLRQRLDDGPMTIEEALATGLGVARGLAAAHARAIVHRDLKPENTFLRRVDGGVKLLDFGLAKLQLSLGGGPEEANRTMAGVILGTAGYMAPEQVKGESVDGRADLFALGVMLYEMSAGQHPFRKGSTFETLHAVVTISPPELSSLNPSVPPTLARIAMRLLQKNPDARFQSAPDVVWALEQADAGTATSPPIPSPTRQSPPWRRARSAVWPAVLAVAAALVFAAVWSLQRVPSREGHTPPLTRFTWPLPSGIGLASAPVVSPDSRTIAFVGRSGIGSQLYVRGLGEVEASPIPGTEEATHPFWSPDSASLGFFAKGRLMKVTLRGGAPAPLAEALFPFGGTSNVSGTIVFAPDVVMSGLFRVGVDAHGAEPATVLEPSLGDTSHCWPAFLPDGIHFLYFVRSAQDERRGLYLGRIDRTAAPAGTQLLRSDSNAVYVTVPGTSRGLLLYIVNDRIEARRFDAQTLTLAGDARTIGVMAAGTTLTQPAMLSASADVLVFATSTVPHEFRHRLEAVDRNGHRLRVWNMEAQNWPSLSPDGRYLARERVDDLRNTPDIWVEDLERGASVRVTTAVEPDLRPVWSPDGRYLAYVTGTLPFRPGTRVLHIAAADGTGVVRELPCPGEYCEPTDWTPRGLLVNVLSGQRSDVWMVPTEGAASAHPLLAEALDKRDARMSRDGRWVAYVSWESGRPEVSVRSVSGPPKRIPVSNDGGDQPVWRRDNAELFFIDPRGQLQSVNVQWDGEGIPAFGLPMEMKNVPSIGRGHWGTPYDVSRDGSRIYFLRLNDDPLPREIHVVIGWRALLD